MNVNVKVNGGSKAGFGKRKAKSGKRKGVASGLGRGDQLAGRPIGYCTFQGRGFPSDEQHRLLVPTGA